MSENTILQQMKDSWKSEWFIEHSIKQNRLIICDVCENKNVSMGVRRCSECGCVLVWKTSYTKSKCPIGKW